VSQRFASRNVFHSRRIASAIALAAMRSQFGFRRCRSTSTPLRQGIRIVEVVHAPAESSFDVAPGPETIDV
jgi:hypothetical protein